MAKQYFSDKERGPKPRTKEDINLEVWKGFLAAKEFTLNCLNTLFNFHHSRNEA